MVTINIVRHSVHVSLLNCGLSPPPPLLFFISYCLSFISSTTTSLIFTQTLLRQSGHICVFIWTFDNSDSLRTDYQRFTRWHHQLTSPAQSDRPAVFKKTRWWTFRSDQVTRWSNQIPQVSPNWNQQVWTERQVTAGNLPVKPAEKQVKVQVSKAPPPPPSWSFLLCFWMSAKPELNYQIWHTPEGHVTLWLLLTWTDTSSFLVTWRGRILQPCYLSGNSTPSPVD